MKLDAMSQTSWVAVIALVAVVGCGVLHYMTVTGKREHLATLQRELDAFDAERASSHGTADDLPRLRREARAFADRVPTNTDLSAMLEALGSELDESSVLEREVLTRPTAPAGAGLSRIPVTVKFRGPYDRALSVLEHVEGSPRVARLDRLLLERTDTSRAAGAGPAQQAPRGAGGTADDGPMMLRVELEFSTFARGAGPVGGSSGGGGGGSGGEERGPWARVE